MPVIATRSVWLMPSFFSTAESTVYCCFVKSLAPDSRENRSLAYCTQRRKRCEGDCDRSKAPSPLRGPFEAIAQPPGRDLVDYYFLEIVRTRRTSKLTLTALRVNATRREQF